jgi:hypothetical protein
VAAWIWFGGKFKMKSVNLFVVLGLALVIFIWLGVENVEGQSNTYCCEKTISGAFCQNVPQSECDSGTDSETGQPFRKVPTRCDQTSYCKAGTCFDSNEGICLDNTPQIVCNKNGGIWSEEFPPQCELGCCILGDQAAFVSLVRCKRLSASLGLETNYDTSFTSELQCIAAVQAQDRGACVFDFEFERNCKFTTRSVCDGSSDNSGEVIVEGIFFKDKLCSAEELGTICGPSTQTTCVPGKDEVYFVDTCGNAANVYDASKTTDKDYWTNVKSKTESCNAASGNIESASCGNCNYLDGSYCRSEDISGGNPTHGDFICADLNCEDAEGGKRLHGESWCENDNVGKGDATATVGSRFFRRICLNGEVTVETCEDFRGEVCIEDKIGEFSQAACRVNRWQDCVAQESKADCENTDRRDCVWKSSTCLPQYSPGLNFWNSEETQEICSQGDAVCVVEFKKDLFGSKDCEKNCHCLTAGWDKEKSSICIGLGDCGPNTNWIGEEGFGSGFTKVIERQ